MLLPYLKMSSNPMYPTFKCSQINKHANRLTSVQINKHLKGHALLILPQQHYTVSSRGGSSSPELRDTNVKEKHFKGCNTAILKHFSGSFASQSCNNFSTTADLTYSLRPFYLQTRIETTHSQ